MTNQGISYAANIRLESGRQSNSGDLSGSFKKPLFMPGAPWAAWVAARRLPAIAVITFTIAQRQLVCDNCLHQDNNSE